MNFRKKNIVAKLLILVSVTLVIVSCSTKKNNFVNRKYHNTTAKYNGYFNGNESLKAGIKKLEENDGLKEHLNDKISDASILKYKSADLGIDDVVVEEEPSE